jgi:methylphosphotriester-DNA--protein-cysteine methyltransferase
MGKNVPSIERALDPEVYRDTGCAVHSACLSCPLPRCRYDEPGWLQREERSARDAEVLTIRAHQALTVEQLASRFNLSQRTVHRILQRSRAA